MGVLDFLKKIGVVQVSGGAGVYKKASERPGYLEDTDYSGGEDAPKPESGDRASPEPADNRDD